MHLQAGADLHRTQPSGGPAEASGRFVYSLPGVLTIALIYGFAHFTARLLASGNLGEDDPIDNVLVQTLAPGYTTTLFPLYDWLLWTLQQLAGTGVHAFLLLKYSLLIILAGFLFATARRVTGSAVWALLAVESMSLTYQIFWRVHEGFTHRMGAMVLAMATLWGLVRLLDHGRRRDYCLLGILIGFGLLSERSYYLLLIALLAAACLQPAARRRLCSPWMLAVAVIAGLIVSPYIVWLLEVPQRLPEFTAGLLPWSADRGGPALWRALYAAMVQPMLALAPFIFILPAVFPGLFRGLAGRPFLPTGDHGPADLRQLLLHALLVQAVLLVGGGAFWLRHYDYPAHLLLPMLLIAVIWLADVVRASAPDPVRLRRFMRLTLFLILVAFVGRAANMFILDPVCSRCRWGVPYDGLAATMREKGFREGTILSEEFETAGNLRRFFPQARFVVGTPRYLPPGAETARTGQLAILWPVFDTSPGLPPSLASLLPTGLDAAGLRAERVAIPWRHLWKPVGYRHSEWWLLVVENPGRPAPVIR
jgi:hypothetical protein